MSTEPLGSLLALQNLRSPISTQPLSSTCVDGAIVPLCRPASAVTTLNVDPVGVQAVRGAVEQRGARLLAEERVVALLRDRLRQQVGVEGRIGAHPEDLAVVGVHRHEGGRLPAGVALAGERLLPLALQREVERQLEALPGLRRHLAQLALRVAEGVDLDLARAVGAAQVAVVLVLQATLAHDGALLDAAEVLPLELLELDLPDRAQHLGGERRARVLAQVDLLDGRRSGRASGAPARSS